MKNPTTLSLAAALLLFAQGAFADDHKSHHKASEMFSKCDTNNDGMISKEEFIAEKTKKFEKHDLNNDGSISKDEHNKMYDEMKNNWHSDRPLKSKGN